MASRSARRIPAAALLALAVLGVARCGGGCGSASSAKDTAGGGDAGTELDLHTDVAGEDHHADVEIGADATCYPQPIPPQVPEHWVPYTDWSCTYPFYVPDSAEHMPAPIAWEACPPEVTTTGVVCRSMKVDWPHNDSPIGTLNARMWIPNDGSASVITFERNSYVPGIPPWVMVVIADVDGVVRSAIMQPRPAAVGTDLSAQDVMAGRFALQVRGEGESYTYDSHRFGALIGTVGDLRPKLFARFDDGRVYSFRIGGEWLARGDAPTLEIWFYPLDGGAPFLVTSPAIDPDGLQPDEALYSSFALFNMTTLHMAGVMIYDDARKLQPLIRWYGDLKQGAVNAGTDEKDIVWTYGTDHPIAEGPYPTRSIMTSPFSRNASEIKPRRLRSDPNQELDPPFAVGCGYAARFDGQHGLLVVRLSDGVSWDLAPQPGGEWERAIGITCDEVFATFVAPRATADGGIDYEMNIARVRIDSLGPGLQPD